MIVFFILKENLHERQSRSGIPGSGDRRVTQRLTPTYHQVEGRIKNMLIKIYVLLYIKYMSDKPLLLPQEAMGFNGL